MIPRNKHNSLLIIELVGGNVHYQATTIKPRMGIAFTLTKYIIKLTMALILKILGKQERCITTDPTGKILKTGAGEHFRCHLFNYGSEPDSGLIQLCIVSVDLWRQEIFFHTHYPMPERNLKP